MMKTMLWACLMAGLATGAQAMPPAAAADCAEECAPSALPALVSLYEAARSANLAQFQQSLAQLPSLAAVGAAEFASEASPQARMGLLQAIIWPSDALLVDADHWVDRGIDNTALRQRFEQERGLRQHMLALALNQGLSPTTAAEETPLALALAAGSPVMVDALLAAGADPNQQNDVGQAPLTVLFSERFAGRLLAPLAQDYVTAAERSDMVLALIKAGAQRPYPQRSMAEWQKKPLYERDLTWLLLWRDTAGSEVVDALLALGALPDAIADQRPLNHAVVYGRLDGVQRLQTLLPRMTQWLDEANEDVVAQPFDEWLNALTFALYLPQNRSHDALLKSLYRPDMAVRQQRSQVAGGELYQTMPAELRVRLQGQPEYVDVNLLGHAFLAHRSDWVKTLIQDGASLDEASQQALLVSSILQQDEALLKDVLYWYPTAAATGAHIGYGFDSSPVAVAMNRGEVKLLRRLLAKLTPEQVAALNQRQDANLLWQLTQFHDWPARPDGQSDPGRIDDATAVAMAKLLVGKGFNLNGLDAEAVKAALEAELPLLAEYFVDQGVMPTLTATADEQQAGYDWAWFVALQHNRVGLAQRLAQRGAATEKFMIEPETLLAHLVTDAKVTRETLRYAAQASGEALADVCVLNGYALMGLSHQPQRISMLQQEGMRFGQTCPQSKLPMLLSWLTVLSLHPKEPPLLGASEDKMVALLREAVSAGMDIEQPVFSTDNSPLLFRSLGLLPLMEPNFGTHWSLTQLARATSRHDVLRVLARAQGHSEPMFHSSRMPVTAYVANAAEQALSKQVTGHYRLDRVADSVGDLWLKPDGHFEFFMTNSAGEAYSKGQWWVQNNEVIRLASEATPMGEFFALTRASAITTEPIRVTITSGNDVLFGALRLSMATAGQQVTFDAPSKTYQDEVGNVTAVYEVATEMPLVGMAFAIDEINQNYWYTFTEETVQGQRQLILDFKFQQPIAALSLLLSYEKGVLRDGLGTQSLQFIQD